MNKKLDVKTIFIIILGSLLILTIIGLAFKNKIDYKKAELKTLEHQNDSLLNANKATYARIDSLNNQIAKINELVEKEKLELTKTQKQLKDLKNKQNEIPNHVGRMSASDVAIEFTKYLNKQEPSSNCH